MIAFYCTQIIKKRARSGYPIVPQVYEINNPRKYLWTLSVTLLYKAGLPKLSLWADNGWVFLYSNQTPMPPSFWLTPPPPSRAPLPLLLKVIASNEESKNHWQQKDYKGFNSSTDWDTADFSKVPRVSILLLYGYILSSGTWKLLAWIGLWWFTHDTMPYHNTPYQTTSIPYHTISYDTTPYHIKSFNTYTPFLGQYVYNPLASLVAFRLSSRCVEHAFGTGII